MALYPKGMPDDARYHLRAPHIEAGPGGVPFPDDDALVL